MTILYFYTGFEWDQEKAVSNSKKHGVRFSEAATVWRDHFARSFYDPDHSEAEDRWLFIGLSAEGRVLVVCYCERHHRIRLISARHALTREMEQYWEWKR